MRVCIRVCVSEYVCVYVGSSSKLRLLSIAISTTLSPTKRLTYCCATVPKIRGKWQLQVRRSWLVVGYSFGTVYKLQRC